MAKRVLIAVACFLSWWLCLAPATFAQTVNMSHDLVRLGIASRNLTPDSPTLDARPLIQAAIEYTRAHTVTTLTVDKGDYYLLTPQHASATVSVAGISNLQIDLAGSTIYFKGPLLPNGIELVRCANVVLKNFRTDFLVTPYTHAEVEGVDPTQGRITYRPLAGWPDPQTLANLVSPWGDRAVNWAGFFRRGAILPGTGRTRLARIEADRTLVIGPPAGPGAEPEALATIQPGDTVVVTARGGGAPILVWEGDSVTLSGIDVHGSPTFAVQIFNAPNTLVDGVRITPRPVDGLVASNADGIHFSATRENNRLRNSYVSRTFDDAIAMDNLYLGIVRDRRGPRTLRVTREGYQRFANGALMNLVDPATAAESPAGVIVSQNPPDGDSPEFNGQVDVTFDRDLPPVTATAGLVHGSTQMRGGGSVIEDNVVEDTYGGRGIWISGMRDTVVRRNVVRRSSDAAIDIQHSTDLNGSAVGPPSHDVTIRDNVLEASGGPAAHGSGAQDALAAIQVVSLNNQQFGFGPIPVNTSIAILDNRITNSARSAIWIGETDGATVEGNAIGSFHQRPDLPIFGIPPPFIQQVTDDFALPIAMRYSANVAVAANSSLDLRKVVEYYNADLDHYFITWAPGEIDKLDAGVEIQGWKRTGQEFNAYAIPQVGTSAVCRFYIPPLLGNSHFFGRGEVECDKTRHDNPSFVLEDALFMHMYLPSAGTCPQSTTPIYRVFSDRPDANHRYMVDKIIRARMVSAHWLAEGDGAELVVMCAPQ